MTDVPVTSLTIGGDGEVRAAGGPHSGEKIDLKALQEAQRKQLERHREMTEQGTQFYLDRVEQVPIADGQMSALPTPWAVSSIAISLKRTADALESIRDRLDKLVEHAERLTRK